MQHINLIDLIIIFSEDAIEWDKYLTNRLTKAIECASVQLRIVHERIENIETSNCFELTNGSIQTILVIISPDFINYLNKNANLVKYYFNRLKSNFENTICLLCGVKLNDILPQLKSNFVHFHKWKCLEAIEQNNDFVYNVIDTMKVMLQQNGHLENDIYSSYNFITSKTSYKKADEIPNYVNEYKNLDSLDLVDSKSLNDSNLSSYEKLTKPQFKLTPRKVREGNKKVFILLDKEIDFNLKGKVVLEYKSNVAFKEKKHEKSKQEIREVMVYKKNPFTLYFSVPDNLLKSSKVIQVTLIYEGGPQNRILGSRPLKCECKMGEFSHFLDKLNNSVLFMQQCLGLQTLNELDLELCKQFKKTLPLNNHCLNWLINQENDFLDDFLKKKNKTKLKDTNNDKQIKDFLTGDIDNVLFKDEDKINEENDLDRNLTGLPLNKKNTMNSNKLFNIKNQSIELPSLLHFSAAYGLQEFTKCLLEFACSLSNLDKICNLKNCNGLTPAQLASRNQYYNISKLIINYYQNFKTSIHKNILQLNNESKEYVNLNNLDKHLINKSNLEEKVSSKSSSSSTSLSEDQLIENTNLLNNESSGSDYYNSPILHKSKPKIDNLINLDEMDGDNSFNLKPKKNHYSTYNVNYNNNILKDNFDYDVVASGIPRRANPLTPTNLQTKNSTLNLPQTVLFERLTDLRLSSCSSLNKSDTKTTSSNDLSKHNDLSDLQTSALTESQIELMNIINAFKTGTSSIDEMERMFKIWTIKYKYNLNHSSLDYVCSNSLDQSFSDLPQLPSLVKNKRSASPSNFHANKDLQNASSKKSNTIKTYLSNINLNNPNNANKLLSTKQFSLTDWLHQLASKLKHKSSKFDKNDVHKQGKISSVWMKRLSASNLHNKSATLNKEFEKKPDTFKCVKKDVKLKSMTFPLGIDCNPDNHKLDSLDKSKQINVFLNEDHKLDSNLNIQTENNKFQFNILNKNKSNKNNWNAFKLDENNKIILNSTKSSELGKYNSKLSLSYLCEYDKIPFGPPVPAKTMPTSNSFIH